MASVHGPAVGLVVLMLAMTALYVPHVQSAGFVYEDRNNIQNTYAPWAGVPDEVASIVLKPARALTSAVQRVIGFDEVRQHRASLVLHLLTGLVLWRVALALLSPWAAVVAAGMFWLAPWQVEAVAYAAARADVLLTLAVLLGAWAVLAGRLWLAFAAAVAAVLAKESGVAAWMLLPAFAWWLGDRWPWRWARTWTATGLVGALVALRTLDTHAATWRTVPRGLRDLTALLLTPPWALSIDPPTASLWPLTLVTLAVAWGLVAAPRWTVLVAGGVLLAWLPRLVVPLAEGPHVHHLYLSLAVLSLGAGKLLSPLIEG